MNQTRDLNQRRSRKVAGSEVLEPHFVDRPELGQIGHEYLHPNDILKARSGLGQSIPEIRQDLPSLSPHVVLADELHVLIERELSGHEDHRAPTDTHCVGKGDGP